MCATSAIRVFTLASRSQSATCPSRIGGYTAACVQRVRKRRRDASATRVPHGRVLFAHVSRVGPDSADADARGRVVATWQLVIRSSLCLLLYTTRISDFINFWFVRLGVSRSFWDFWVIFSPNKRGFGLDFRGLTVEFVFWPQIKIFAENSNFVGHFGPSFIPWGPF